MLAPARIFYAASGSNLLSKFGEAKDLYVMYKFNLWYVYIIECKDKKLYVGIAKDLDRRIKLHNKGLACRFTKYRRPVTLVYKKLYNSKSRARKRELELKGYSRKRRLALFKNRSFGGYNPLIRRIA